MPALKYLVLALDDREIHVAIAKARSDAPKKQSRKAGLQGDKEASQAAAEDKVPAGDDQVSAGPAEDSQEGKKQPRSQRKKVQLEDLTTLSISTQLIGLCNSSVDSVPPVVSLRKTMTNRKKGTLSLNKRLTDRLTDRRSLEPSETGSQSRTLQKPMKTPPPPLRGGLTMKPLCKIVLRALPKLLLPPGTRNFVSLGF